MVNQPVVFRRSELYKTTYLDKVLSHPSIKNKFRAFMEIKRTNPTQPFGSSDKPFLSAGNFAAAVPGLRHAHVTHDISIVYKVVDNQVYLYGFFTHDDLGTGQPANINRQKSIAKRFSNVGFG
jgi:mRNA-degrading endonuclease YafQ of YafQ-DinJ toxin-antitoxin module